MPFDSELNRVMSVYQSVFSAPTWRKVQPLVEGVLLGRGPRTVASALRASGYAQAVDFSRYHQVLNRAEWSSLRLSRRLLGQISKTFFTPNSPLCLAIDETLERRWGKKISTRSHFRDPLASSRRCHIASSGLRWIVLSVIVKPVWTNRAWALPILSVLAPARQTSERLHRRHKTVATWAQQMISWVRRQLPERDLSVMGDQHYGVQTLAATYQRRRVRLIAPLLDDARLYSPPSPPMPGEPGRPATKGARLPTPMQRYQGADTPWQRVRLRWYDGRRRQLELTSATGQWYRCGKGQVAVRYVVVRDPKARLPRRIYFSTMPDDTPRDIVQRYLLRWTIEVLFEEARAHLGIETQRQWTDRAIARITPLLYGLYSLTAVVAHRLHAQGQLTLARSAWYRKTKATFADALATLRRHLWIQQGFDTAVPEHRCIIIPSRLRQRIEYALFYAR